MNCDKWLSPEGLTLLTAWARDGLDREQLAKKCATSQRTLRQWEVRYPPIAQALLRGRELEDIEVENALLKKCHGYTMDLCKSIKLKHIEYDPATGKKIREWEELVPSVDQVHVPADVNAQKYWLKNRAPDRWRDKPEGEAATEVEDFSPIAGMIAGGGVDCD